MGDPAGVAVNLNCWGDPRPCGAMRGHGGAMRGSRWKLNGELPRSTGRGFGCDCDRRRAMGRGSRCAVRMRYLLCLAQMSYGARLAVRGTFGKGERAAGRGMLHSFKRHKKARAAAGLIERVDRLEREAHPN